jgi:hypothetical protein
MSTRTTPKTPYEIRLDLLQLAFDVLVQKHQALAANKTHDPASMLVTSSPSTEEVIAEAEKMNAFISKANQQTH